MKEDRFRLALQGFMESQAFTAKLAILQNMHAIHKEHAERLDESRRTRYETEWAMKKAEILSLGK